MPLSDKIDKQIREIAYQTVMQVVTRQNQTNANQSGMGEVKRMFLDDNGNRKAEVKDQYGKIRTVSLISSRVMGPGDAIVLINNSLGQ